MKLLCNEVEQLDVMKGGTINLLVKHENTISGETVNNGEWFGQTHHSIKISWLELSSLE